MKVCIILKANVMKFLPTSAIFGPELEKCGQHTDGILFLYKETTSELTMNVWYKSMSLQKSKRKGWLPCSDVFNNSAHSVEVGDVFPVDRVIYEVVHTYSGHEATVRRLDNRVFNTMSAAYIICYLNASSIS
jgi:hypothetical protein